MDKTNRKSRRHAPVKINVPQTLNQPSSRISKISDAPINFSCQPKNSSKPDHGKSFIPGNESTSQDLAPKPLDHFRRGYKERAELRERELSNLKNDFEQNSHEDHSQLNRSNKHINNKLSEKNQIGNERCFHNSKLRSFSNKKHNNQTGFEVTKLVDALCDPSRSLTNTLDEARKVSIKSFESGKAITAILSNLARRRKMRIALSVWDWMENSGLERNVFHFNSLIHVFEKMKDWKGAINVLDQMDREGVTKNEVTFSSAISACEKSGNWKTALDLLQRMKKDNITRTTIAYNAAISACEKGLNPSKAMEVFELMKKEGVKPTVVTYSALISACEKGQQWKLALSVLDEMKVEGHGANVIAYSAAITALSKGQQWEKALELFREIESSGGQPSVITYNATMSALEKGLQWERALMLFDEMKRKKLQVTVVSYGTAISACEKGYQWGRCLNLLDEMTEKKITKNVVIFGAAMSCMEKCCRADIAFQLMDKMKVEGVRPNVHIYNSAISACARCNMWKRGLQLFYEMEHEGVLKDVVTYNAVLDTLCGQVKLAKRIFQEGIDKGFYSKVSRLGTQWLELDLHFLSLGAGEIAICWWFEECLVPYLGSHEKLSAVKSIDIVTGYGKSRLRGVRQGNDGMRKRVRAMLKFMNIHEIDQPNKGRIHVDKEALIREVDKNGGRILFDSKGYIRFRKEETTAHAMPNAPQLNEGNWNENWKEQAGQSEENTSESKSKCSKEETNNRTKGKSKSDFNRQHVKTHLNQSANGVKIYNNNKDDVNIERSHSSSGRFREKNDSIWSQNNHGSSKNRKRKLGENNSSNEDQTQYEDYLARKRHDGRGYFSSRSEMMSQDTRSAEENQQVNHDE